MAITHTTTATGGDSAGLIGQTQWNEAHTGIAGDGGFSFKYAFDTATGGSPATGTLQLNNATPSSATQMFIYDTDAGGVYIDALTNLINPTDFIMLSNSDKSKHQTFFVILPPSEVGHVDTITFKWLCGTGAGATNFSASEQIFVTIQHADFDDVIGSVFALSNKMNLP